MPICINKTMDREDLDSPAARTIVAELNDLVRLLSSRRLKISSWHGSFALTGEARSFERINRGIDYHGIAQAADDALFPWFLYWQIAWVILHNSFRSGMRLLDLGGSSSLFSYYLAAKGLAVTTVDINRQLVDNANCVAAEMGWALKNCAMDMTRLEFASQFDHITSICVYEHIPMFERVAINHKIKALLASGGTFSITFDYRNPSRRARISSSADIIAQFVAPSGLEMRENQEFYDNGKNYLLQPFFSRQWPLWKKMHLVVKRDFSPRDLFKVQDTNDYTFGALFLRKPPHDLPNH